MNKEHTTLELGERDVSFQYRIIPLSFPKHLAAGCVLGAKQPILRPLILTSQRSVETIETQQSSVTPAALF